MHDALNNRWASSQGTKKCPVRRVWIQKTDGCNHVKCRCGAHICWLCEQSFANGNQTYRHLRSAHGMWGLYLDPNEGVNVGGAAMQGGGAGQQRAGDGFFGAPPRPGEVLIAPGGEVAVGPGVNATWFARCVAQGAGGIAHLANMVPNLRRPISAPVVPQKSLFLPGAVVRQPNQAPGHAVPPSDSCYSYSRLCAGTTTPTTRHGTSKASSQYRSSQPDVFHTLLNIAHMHTHLPIHKHHCKSVTLHFDRTHIQMIIQYIDITGCKYLYSLTCSFKYN